VLSDPAAALTASVIAPATLPMVEGSALRFVTSTSTSRLSFSWV
jgi:hypothetical protein